MKRLGLTILGFIFINPYFQLIASSAQAWRKYQAGRQPLVEFLITIGIFVILIFILKFFSNWYNKRH